MNRVYLILIVILIVLMTGCGRYCKQTTNELIMVDVTKSYSFKKEVVIQDFMDVEYVVLETKDDFLNQGFVQAIGKEFILVKNRNDDGDIFVYDRFGKALRKINRKGQGNEEYIFMYNIALDENNEEMFVNDLFAKKIVVYDLYGNFKRSFKHKEDGGSMFYTDIFNYDEDNLICFDEYNADIAFVIVSKHDGSIVNEIKIPFTEKKFLRQNSSDITVTPGPYSSIIPYKGDWKLLEFSSDTVYTLSSDFSLHPFLVRSPSIQSMSSDVFLILRLLSDRYYFIETIKNVYNFDKQEGFPRAFFMYDTQEKTFSGYTVYNGDYLTKKEIYMSVLRPVNQEIVSWYPIEANQLVDSYKKGELKGKLKEIAATLNEESNTVIMLIKHKK